MSEHLRMDTCASLLTFRCRLLLVLTSLLLALLLARACAGGVWNVAFPEEADVAAGDLGAIVALLELLLGCAVHCPEKVHRAQTC